LGGSTICSNGKVKIWDIDINENRKQTKLAIGIVPQELNIDPFFNPKESLDFQAGLFNVPKKNRITNKLLRMMNLIDKAYEYSRNLSGGMRRRLLVAKAMVHQPPILILDEPTAGVDIDLRRKLWNYFKKINSYGITIILTTHYLEEAEYLCDDIAIIHKGKIVLNGKKNELLSKIDQKVIKLTLKEQISLSQINSLNNLGEVKLLGNVCNLIYQPSKISINEILSSLKKNKIMINDLQTKDVRLEDIFLMFTNN